MKSYTAKADVSSDSTILRRNNTSRGQKGAPSVIVLGLSHRRLWSGGLFVFLSLAMFLWAMRSPNPPAGLYEIDEQGEPLEYLGRALPPELRKTRPVTWEAFQESVRARGPAR